MKNEILALLKENENTFISGQDICEKLKVSRTSIWKGINGLKNEGYIIESKSNNGYKLIASPDILTFEEISKNLNTDFIGRSIIHFDSIDSTNNKAKELANEGAASGTLVLSEEQTSGRGRMGRNWVSPKGTGIWMSIILRPDVNPVNAFKLTQVAVAAVSKTLEEFGVASYIKWPNDLIINGKKICGILTEMSAELTKINYVIMGIGINVNILGFPDELKDIATSLKIETGMTFERNNLISAILNNFQPLYSEFIEEESICSSINICREKSILIGKTLKVLKRDCTLTAKAIGITDDGQLTVVYENGKLENLISGEVSIRGMELYI